MLAEALERARGVVSRVGGRVRCGERKREVEAGAWLRVFEEAAGTPVGAPFLCGLFFLGREPALEVGVDAILLFSGKRTHGGRGFADEQEDGFDGSLRVVLE